MSKNSSAMNPMDNCWMQCHAGSLPAAGEMSQNNFFQQRQQPSCNRPTQQQTQCPNFPMNQHGTYFQSQPDQFTSQVPPQHVTIQPGLQQPQQIPGNSQPAQGQFTCSLPPGLIEQIRAWMPATSGPIFILPNNPMPQQASPPSTSNYPGVNYPGQYCCQPSYYPCPIPMPLMSPFVLPQQSSVPSCSCCPRKHSEDTKKQLKNESNEQQNQHQCMEIVGDETAMCVKKNCPASINLQALASQLLAIQGVISCAATRLILRKVPGSNIVDRVEEVIERGKKAINGLNQDQLLAEIRSAQQVNALINLHMTASPPASVIPVLTTVQLKINLLKSHADGLINRRLSENQGMGAEGSGQLDPLILSLKSDEELRTLLTVLRQKECNERVNYSFAPYQSQRIIAETRLRNVENKINQVEIEMERRRSSMIPRGISGNFAWNNYSSLVPFGRGKMIQAQTYESPDPFQIFQLTNPRRLNLKPHVGSPETTYRQTRVITFDEDKSQDGKRIIVNSSNEDHGNSLKIQDDSKVENYDNNLTDFEKMEIKSITSPTNMSCDSGTLETKLSNKNIKVEISSSISV